MRCEGERIGLIDYKKGLGIHATVQNGANRASTCRGPQIPSIEVLPAPRQRERSLERSRRRLLGRGYRQWHRLRAPAACL